MRIKKTTFIFTVLILIAVVSTGAAYYFYNKVSSLQSNSQRNAEEIKEVVAKVGKLLVIPEGEVPTLATVVDPEKLRDQPFFANAKNGDKVLIYAGAKKAILYDPVANKIVEVAPINIGNPPPSSPAPSPSR